MYNLLAALPEEKQHEAQRAMAQMHDAFAALARHHDIATREKEELRRKALIDELTGVPNENGIMYDLRGRLENMKRYGDKDVAFVYIDLDGFKEINDRFGHETGDAALKKVASRLAVKFRGIDTVGRLHGDEMAIVLSYENDECFAPDQVEQKIREVLKSVIYWDDAGPHPVGASIGISYRTRGMPFGGQDIETVAEEMKAEADKKMYKDKEGKPERQQQRINEINAEIPVGKGLKPPGSEA
ncbi:MAG: GGDEF domain-containing protein [Rhodospirillales bacterium]|nr:GGDEF domain-containing protein [Rhodospirillales bacterium]